MKEIKVLEVLGYRDDGVAEEFEKKLNALLKEGWTRSGDAHMQLDKGDRRVYWQILEKEV